MTADDAGRAFSGLFVTSIAQAQIANGGGGGLTCGWCESGVDFIDVNGIWRVGHRFPHEGDGCGWIGNGGGNGGSHLSGGGLECVRCGGTSSCHWGPLEGSCHIECGPGGGEQLAAAIADLKESIERQDAHGIVRVVHAVPGLDFSRHDSSVRAAEPCHDAEAELTFRMPPSLAERVSALIQAQ